MLTVYQVLLVLAGVKEVEIALFFRQITHEHPDYGVALLLIRTDSAVSLPLRRLIYPS
jgi:hypothetical protein